MVLFFRDHTKKSPNATKMGVLAGTRENTNGTFGCKNAILGRGLEKGVLLSVIHKSRVLLKTQFYSVLIKHSFAEITAKNRNLLKKLGVVCQHVKGVFLFFLIVFVF